MFAYCHLSINQFFVSYSNQKKKKKQRMYKAGVWRPAAVRVNEEGCWGWVTLPTFYDWRLQDAGQSLDTLDFDLRLQEAGQSLDTLDFDLQIF